MTTTNATRPATGLNGFLFSRIANAARSVAALIKARQDLKLLRDLDDHTLADIGLSRSDLYAAGWTPPATHPLDLLYRVSRAP